jgi:hypothetical protein
MNQLRVKKPTLQKNRKPPQKPTKSLKNNAKGSFKRTNEPVLTTSALHISTSHPTSSTSKRGLKTKKNNINLSQHNSTKITQQSTTNSQSPLSTLLSTTYSQTASLRMQTARAFATISATLFQLTLQAKTTKKQYKNTRINSQSFQNTQHLSFSTTVNRNNDQNNNTPQTEQIEPEAQNDGFATSRNPRKKSTTTIDSTPQQIIPISPPVDDTATKSDQLVETQNAQNGDNPNGFKTTTFNVKDNKNTKPANLDRFKLFCEENPVIGKMIKRWIALAKFSACVGILGGVVFALASQVSSYAMLAHPAKEALGVQSAAAMAGALEEMASLGLINLKFIPTSIVEAMKNPDNLTFGKDPYTLIEKPEIGYFIQSAEIFNTRTLPSSAALPRHHDSFMIEADPLPEYIHREAIRNQFVDFNKALNEIGTYGEKVHFLKLQTMQATLSAYMNFFIEQPAPLHFLSHFKQSPLYAIDRVVDVLWMRDNEQPEILHEIMKDLSPESQNNLSANYQYSREASMNNRRDINAEKVQEDLMQTGANIQHHLLSQNTDVGRMLTKLDDRFIDSFRTPEEADPGVLANHHFKEELMNIPDHIKNHPDRTVTGPLFQCYYNIFSRNQYANLLVAEQDFLRGMRESLLHLANSFGIVPQKVPVSGINDNDLSSTEPELVRARELIVDSLGWKVHGSSIMDQTDNSMNKHGKNTVIYNQTPLLNQPFHYFKSTGIPVTEAQFPIPRSFTHADPITNIPSSVPSSKLERYIVHPANVAPQLDYHIDTTSLIRFNRADKSNHEWEEFRTLPTRYGVDHSRGYNPMIPEGEINLVETILSKIDYVMLRNQYEMVRVQQNAIEQNPIFGAQHSERMAQAKKIITDREEAFKRAMEAQQQAQKGQNGEEQSAPWWKFW